MKTAFASVLAVAYVILSAFWACPAVAGETAAGKVSARVLLVTGGHDFEKPQFFEMFKSNPDVSFRAVQHPDAHALLTAAAAREWDILVLYDMHQPITEQAKADFVARLKEGKGLLVLHHAIADYQDWPEYHKIIGARYYLKAMEVDGVKKARSAYKHDVDIPIHVKNSTHPVTAGIKDFVIHDETYRLFDIAPDVEVLLTSDHPDSSPVVAWAKTYEKARVVYIQGGHDHFAYDNPSFRQLLRQALTWVAPAK